MATLLLIIIYIAFIGLGLPDSILGSAWPVLHLDIGASLSGANLITMLITGGTVISSLLSERLIKRFGTGLVTLVSVLMTAVALLGFSFAANVAWLVVLAVPLGLGAGSVDAGLNNYIAIHYEPRHMSWLHCFWGLGAFTGPMVMSQFIRQDGNWRGAYLVIAVIQFAIVLLLFLSLRLWKTDNPVKISADYEPLEEQERYIGNVFRIPGVLGACSVFVCYSGLEATLNYWGSSYLVYGKGFSAADAAKWVAFVFGGITLGRLLTGFLTAKLSNRALIRIGILIVTASSLLALVPFGKAFPVIGIVGAGLGCASIFPCMLHETPKRFGAANSQKIMGIQMACAYTGGTFLPPLFNLIASRTTLAALPVFMLGYSLLMLFGSEQINRMMAKRSRTAE